MLNPVVNYIFSRQGLMCLIYQNYIESAIALARLSSSAVLSAFTADFIITLEPMISVFFNFEISRSLICRRLEPSFRFQ